jgi:hypothetical protein
VRGPVRGQGEEGDGIAGPGGGHGGARVGAERDGRGQGRGDPAEQAVYFLLEAIKAGRVAGAELQRAWGIVVTCIEKRSASEAPLEARVWEPVRDMLLKGKLGDEIKGELADALARYLGPVHCLWKQGRELASCWSQGLSKGVKVSPFNPRAAVGASH